MNTDKRKIVIRYIRLSLVLFVIALFTKTLVLPEFKYFTNRNLSKEEIKSKTKKSQIQYMKLFTEETRNKLALTHNDIVKSKHPFSTYLYDNNYEIVVYQVNLVKDISLDKDIIVEKRSKIPKADIVYGGYDLGDIKFEFSSEHDSLVSNIYLTYDDSLINKTNIGDSILNFVLLIKQLSFRYEFDAPRDFGFIAQQRNWFQKSNSQFVMDVALYRKETSVFIIIMYTRRKNIEIDNSNLLRLLGVPLEVK